MPGRRVCNILEVNRIIPRAAALDHEKKGGDWHTGRIQKISSYPAAPASMPDAGKLEAILDHETDHGDELYRAPTTAEMHALYEVEDGTDVGEGVQGGTFCKAGDVLEVIFDIDNYSIISGTPYIRLGSSRAGTTVEYPNVIARDNQTYPYRPDLGAPPRNVSRLFFVVPQGATSGYLTVMGRRSSGHYRATKKTDATSIWRGETIFSEPVPIFVGPNTTGKVTIDAFQIGKTNVDRDAAAGCKNLEEYTMPWGAFTNNGSTSTIGSSPLPTHAMSGGYGASSSSSYTGGGSYWPIGFTAQQVHYITNYAKEMAFKVGISSSTNSLAKMAIMQMGTFMAAGAVLAPIGFGFGAMAMFGGAMASAYLAGIALGQASGGGSSIVKLHRRRAACAYTEKERADVTISPNQSANVQFMKLYRSSSYDSGYARSGTLSSFILLDFSRMRYVATNQLHESIASYGLHWDEPGNAIGSPTTSASTKKLDCNGAYPSINIGYDNLENFTINTWGGTTNDSGESGGLGWYFEAGKGRPRGGGSSSEKNLPYQGGGGLFEETAFRRTENWGLVTHELPGHMRAIWGITKSDIMFDLDWEYFGGATRGMDGPDDTPGGNYLTWATKRKWMGDLFCGGVHIPTLPDGGSNEPHSSKAFNHIGADKQRFFTLGEHDAASIPYTLPSGPYKDDMKVTTRRLRTRPGWWGDGLGLSFEERTLLGLPCSWPSPKGSIIPIVSVNDGPMSNMQPGANSICHWNKGDGCWVPDARIDPDQPCKAEGGMDYVGASSYMREWRYPHSEERKNPTDGSAPARRVWRGSMTPGFSPPPFRHIISDDSQIQHVYGLRQDKRFIQFWDAFRSEGLGYAGGLYFAYFYATAIGRKDVVNSRVYSEDFKYVGRGATDWGHDARYCLDNKDALGYGGWFLGEKAEPHFWLEGRNLNTTLSDIESNSGNPRAKISLYERARSGVQKDLGTKSFFKSKDMHRHFDGVEGVCDSEASGQAKNLAGHHYGGWPMNVLHASGPYHRQAGSTCRTQFQSPAPVDVWYKYLRHEGRPLIPSPLDGLEDEFGFWEWCFDWMGCDSRFADTEDYIQEALLPEMAAKGWQLMHVTPATTSVIGFSIGSEGACNECKNNYLNQNLFGASGGAGTCVNGDCHVLKQDAEGLTVQPPEWSDKGQDYLTRGCIKQSEDGEAGHMGPGGNRWTWASEDCCKEEFCSGEGHNEALDPRVDSDCPPHWKNCIKGIIRTYNKPSDLNEDIAFPNMESPWIKGGDPQGSQHGKFVGPIPNGNQGTYDLRDHVQGDGILDGGLIAGAAPKTCLSTPITAANAWGYGVDSHYGYTHLTATTDCRETDSDWHGHGFEMWDSASIPTYQLNDVNWVDIYMGNAKKYDKMRNNGQLLLTEKVDSMIIAGVADGPTANYKTRIEGASPHYEFRPGEWVEIKIFPNNSSTGTPQRAPVLRRFVDTNMLRNSPDHGRSINMQNPAASGGGSAPECPDKQTPTGPIKGQIFATTSANPTAEETAAIGKCPDPNVQEHWTETAPKSDWPNVKVNQVDGAGGTTVGGVSSRNSSSRNLGGGNNKWAQQRTKLVGDNLGMVGNDGEKDDRGYSRISRKVRGRSIGGLGPLNDYGSGRSRGPANILILEKDPEYKYPPAALVPGGGGERIHDIEYLGGPPTKGSPSQSLLFNMNQLCIHVGQSMSSVSHSAAGSSINASLVNDAKDHQSMLALSLGHPIGGSMMIGLGDQMLKGDSSSFHKGVTYDGSQIEKKLDGTSGEAVQPSLFDDALFQSNHTGDAGNGKFIATLGRNGFRCTVERTSLNTIRVEIPQGSALEGLGGSSAKIFTEQIWVQGELEAPGASRYNSFHYYSPVPTPINIYNHDKLQTEQNTSIFDADRPPIIRDLECPKPSKAESCEICYSDGWKNLYRTKVKGECTELTSSDPHEDCKYTDENDCVEDRDCRGVGPGAAPYRYPYLSTIELYVETLGARDVIDERTGMLRASAYQWQFSNDRSSWTNAFGPQASTMYLTALAYSRGTQQPTPRFWRVIVRNKTGTVTSEICDIFGGGDYQIDSPYGECAKCLSNWTAVDITLFGGMDAASRASYEASGDIVAGKFTNFAACEEWLGGIPYSPTTDTGCNKPAS